MTYANSIGKSYEYRLRNWFVEKGWRSERNPLSGASQQISEQLGKHDVRAWKDNIFLQIEAKKTGIKKKNKAGEDDDTMVIQKEWLDKIDFNNDEFLVFSFNRCQQHFAFMTNDSAEKIIGTLGMKKSDVHEAKGGSGFGFKRQWLEDQRGLIVVCDFIGKTWYALDLEEYIDAREKSGIPTAATSFEDKIKSIQSMDLLKELHAAESSTWTTKQNRLYYSKLERLETGEENKYNPEFIKQGQFWLSEDKKFDWDRNTVEQIISKVQGWTDKNLIENEDGEIVWSNESDIATLDKEIAKILGLDKK